MDLELRIKYLGLQTKVYQLDDFRFVIYCENYEGDFEELADDFNSSIRHMGTNVELTKTPPESFKQRIERISLSNVVDGFKATCVTESDIRNFVESKFHYINVTNVDIPHRGLGFEIVVSVSEDTTAEMMEQMQNYLLQADLGTDRITIKHEDFPRQPTNAGADRAGHETVNNLLGSFNVMNLSLYKQLPFTINEADFWFEHAEDIYTGKTGRQDIPFFREGLQKCFLNASVFETVDLRDVLLLYDTVYLALPIENHLDSFLEQQNMTASDLVELVDMGKVVIVLPNQETRYDQNLLLQAYQCNPLSVVGRRGLNALLAAHLVETKTQYEKRYPNIYDASSELFLRGKREGDPFVQRFAQLLAWPVTAAAASFRYLHQHSPMSVANFGVNLIVEESFRGSDLHEQISFELMVNADSTHLATALQSTYFPFKLRTPDGMYSDQAVSNLMGDLLKMYWYDASNLEQIERLIDRNHSENNYLKLFETNPHVKATKVALLADEYDTPKAFRNLLHRLDAMDDATRRQTINEYNDLLFEVVEASGRSSGGFVKMMLGGAGFLPLSYQESFALALVGLVHDKVNALKTVKRAKELDRIEKCIKDSGIQAREHMKEDIYILDKISRVAILKQQVS